MCAASVNWHSLRSKSQTLAVPSLEAVTHLLQEGFLVVSLVEGLYNLHVNGFPSNIVDELLVAFHDGLQIAFFVPQQQVLVHASTHQLCSIRRPTYTQHPIRVAFAFLWSITCCIERSYSIWQLRSTLPQSNSCISRSTCQFGAIRREGYSQNCFRMA